MVSSEDMLEERIPGECSHSKSSEWRGPEGDGQLM